MDPLRAPLPRAAKRNAEIVGCICGLAFFTFAFFPHLLGGILPLGPALLVLPTVTASASAGVIASAVATFFLRVNVPGLRLRSGARAGCIAGLMSGAGTVLASTLHQLDFGTPIDGGSLPGAFFPLLPASPSLRTIVLSLLAFPPSIFFGLCGAFVGSAFTQSPATLEDTASFPSPTSSTTPVFWGVLVVTIAGYLSPLAIGFTASTKPDTAFPVIQPAIEEKPAVADDKTSTPIEIPKWQHRVKEGLDGAEADHLTITENRTIAPISGEMPVAISPDGNLFAFCPNIGGDHVQIVDLRTLDTVTLSAVGVAVSLVWSADSTKFLANIEGKPRRLIVFDVPSARWMNLPQPRNARVPNGIPRWWMLEEVMYRDDGKLAALSLDDLRVRSIELSPNWQKLDATEREKVRSTVSTRLPQSDRWHIEIKPTVVEYDTPFETTGWITKEQWRVSAAHPKRALRSFFPAIDVKVGDVVLGASDGSKIIRIRNNSAAIFYLGTRAPSHRRIKISMPGPAESSLAEHITKKTLCAYICSPLVNPLNGKTVGPDRGRVKAVARLENWTERVAELWIAEDYLPIEEGDVIADFHFWKEGLPQTAGDVGASEWFSVIDELKTGELPLRTAVSPLGRGHWVTADTTRGGDRILEFRAVMPVAPLKETTVGLGDDRQKLEPLLKEFVTNHHLKASRGDIDGLVSDYAERVDHFTNGMVDRAFIRKDEAAYHAPGTQVTEKIVSVPTFERFEHGSFSVRYTIQFHRVRPDGRWTNGLSDVALEISLSSGSPLIVSHRAQTRNQTSGP